MNDRVEFTLFGKPQPKGRPRFTRMGRAYTDERTKAAEQSVLAAWLHAAGDRPPHDGPVTVHLTAAFAPPASWPKWKQQAALDGELRHTTKPDLDNLLKVIDGLNGRAWLDDSQVDTVTVVKHYAAAPFTHITLTFHPRHER